MMVMENGNGVSQVNHRGDSYKFQLIKHRVSLCHEYVIILPTVDTRSWILWTIIFNFIGFSMNLQTHDCKLMGMAIGCMSAVLLLKLYYKVTRESLLVLASTGVQLTTTFALGRCSAKFYDVSNIHDIVINEAISMHRVIAYLTLLVKDKEDSKQKISKLIPLFHHSWPSIYCLQKIYRDVQTLLHSKLNQKQTIKLHSIPSKDH